MAEKIIDHKDDVVNGVNHGCYGLAMTAACRLVEIRGSTIKREATGRVTRGVGADNELFWDIRSRTDGKLYLTVYEGSDKTRVYVGDILNLRQIAAEEEEEFLAKQPVKFFNPNEYYGYTD